MTNAGILIRVSTTRQGEHGTSVETQRADCLAYCERMGWQVAQIEEDHATGTSFDRPGFQRLADAAKAGAFDVLVVYDMSRFGRNTREALIELWAFEQANVEIHSVTEGKQDDPFMRGIRLLVAEQDSRQKSGKVFRAATSLAENGRWVARAPFGYDLTLAPKGVGKILTPNDMAPIVTEMFRRFDAGQTFTDIQRWLRQEHGKTMGLEWVKSQLRNPVFAGDVLYNRRQRGKFKRPVGEVIVTRDAHRALVTREVFDRIQSRFTAPTGIARATSRPLDGLVVCGLCRARMYANKKGKHYYYRCSTHQKLGACTWNQIPYARVEAALENAAASFFPPEAIDQQYDNLYESFLDRIAPDIERMTKGATDVRDRIEAEIKKLEGQQARAFDARLDGGTTAELATRKIDELEDRIKQARAELSTLKQVKMGSDEWWKTGHRQLVARYRAYAKRQSTVERELVRLLVARITITAGVVQVAWTDYAESIGNSRVTQMDGSPSRRPGAGSLTRCSRLSRL